MKKLIFTLVVLFSTLSNSFCQNGLEGVIIEKYYVSNANDASVNSVGGVLPVGSVTWRVYLDMLPDYVFQSAYGDPNHELRIETTTLFFNNEDRGAVHPSFNFSYCDDNTVMLDSWLSTGAACNGRFGILKSEDDGAGTVSNSDGVLQNNDPTIGIYLTQEDGLMLTAGTPEPASNVGIGTEILVFDSQNDGTNGPLFSTNNGAWYTINGASGPDPVTNKVLIMQITTDGELSFKLNVQIRNQLTLLIEQYVADSPVGSEILDSSLNFNSVIWSNTTEIGIANSYFSVYPNPVEDQASVALNIKDGSHHVTYALFDILGKNILNGDLGMLSGESVQNLDFSDITPGLYFLQVDMDGFKMSKKIIRN